MRPVDWVRGGQHFTVHGDNRIGERNCAVSFAGEIPTTGVLVVRPDSGVSQVLTRLGNSAAVQPPRVRNQPPNSVMSELLVGRYKLVFAHRRRCRVLRGMARETDCRPLARFVWAVRKHGGVRIASTTCGVVGNAATAGASAGGVVWRNALISLDPAFARPRGRVQSRDRTHLPGQECAEQMRFADWSSIVVRA